MHHIAGQAQPNSFLASLFWFFFSMSVCITSFSFINKVISMDYLSTNTLLPGW